MISPPASAMVFPQSLPTPTGQPWSTNARNSAARPAPGASPAPMPADMASPTAPMAETVILRFLTALQQRDFDAVERCLSRERFRYVGPTRSFDDARSFVEDISRIGTILKEIEVRRVFVDGDEGCVLFNFGSTLPELDQTRVALWFQAKAGRLVSMEVFYDAYPYSRMFGE